MLDLVNTAYRLLSDFQSRHRLRGYNDDQLRFLVRRSAVDQLRHEYGHGVPTTAYYRNHLLGVKVLVIDDEDENPDIQIAIVL